MVAPSPLAWAPIPARPRRLWRWVLGLVVLLIVAVVVLNSITVSYYALSPGDALAVNGSGGAVTVHANHVGSAKLYLTTVAVNEHVSLWDRMFSVLHPDTTLVPKQDITGGLKPSVYQKQNAQEMADSQLSAKVAALRRLGYHVPEHGDGALILQVEPGTPAEGQLKEGDVITAVDGKTVTLASDATAVIRAHQPSDEVRLDVSRPVSPPAELAVGSTPGKSSTTPANSTPVHLTIRPVACGSRCPGDGGRPLIGVSLATDNQQFDLPKDVGLEIQTNGIGGPSAGLAFTLGSIDALTTHNITGGHKVCVTGTIDPDGTVGEVGGVKQKTVAVEQQGCEYFLVPPEELAAARQKAQGRHLQVVGVSTLNQALDFLRSIHGDLTGVPTTPTTPAG